MIVDKVSLRQRYSLVIFIVIVLASGWLGVLMDKNLPDQPEGNSLGMGIWLILPFIAMIVFRTINRDWKDFGIKLNIKGNVKWYLFAMAIYPAVMLITVLLAGLFNSVDFTAFEFNELLTLIGVAVGGGMIKNVFEEFAWRGYLTPKLIGLRINDWLIYLISGLVWALWHAAYYLVFLPDQYFETTSRVEMIVMGCIIMIGWSVMYVEIYRLTKSVWPCVLMHAVEDGVPTLLVAVSGIITFTQNGELWFNPYSGVVATVLFLGIGLILRSKRIKLENFQRSTRIDNSISGF